MQIDFLRLSGVGLAIKVTVVLKITVAPMGGGGCRGIHVQLIKDLIDHPGSELNVAIPFIVHH